MKIKEKNGQLEITTSIYQGRNGAIYLNWGNKTIKLEKDYADTIARDIPDFDNEQYNKFYN